MLSGIMDHGYHVSARALSCDEICPQDHTWSKGNCEKLIMHPTGLPPPISDKKLIADAIRKCGIPKSKRLIGKKAEEILRIMTIKMPTGHLNMATPCMHLYAIEYACQALKYKLKLREQAPVTLQLYQEGLLRWKQILKVKTEVKSRFKENLGVLSILAINYNFNLPAAAQDILQLFQRKLPKSARSVVKIYSPVYQAAAFFIAAAKINVSFFR